MTVFITSDLHFGHSKIVEYCNRPTTAEEHTDWLINQMNSVVGYDDDVYHVGDFAFIRRTEQIAEILKLLNGNWKFILGNHDVRRTLELACEMEGTGRHTVIGDYLRTKFDSVDVVLFHFPIESWDKRTYGSLHLHGHCVDLNTEILTTDGWKLRSQITVGDTVVSFNMATKQLENDVIQGITDLNYTGTVVKLNGKSYGARLTADHDVVCLRHKEAEPTKMKANAFSERNSALLYLSGVNKDNEAGCGLTENMLKLYIIMAADGTIKHKTNLCRIIINKQYKVQYGKELLENLGIDYKEYIHASGATSLNFYLPEELVDWNIKGLDVKLLSCNKEQADHVLEAYTKSDGCANGNGVIIYSAKGEEIDILQALFVQCGYSATKYSRYHTSSFSDKIQHQLSVYPKQLIHTNPKHNSTKEVVNNEHFWCVTTKNGSWVMRYNGRVHITGNCHGAPTAPIPNRFDVGIDCHPQHLPFTFKELKARMIPISNGRSASSRGQ